MATIRKRGEYQWQAMIRRKGHAPQSRTFENRKDAEAWARKTESEMDRGVFITLGEAEHTTLGEALERYAREISMHKRSGRQEQYRIAMLRRDPLSPRFLATIRGKDVADYRDRRLAAGLSGNAVRLELAIISHLYNVARREWGMEGLPNPVQVVRKPQPKSRERRLRAGEAGALLAASDSPLQEIIVWALETAMRRAEITGLRWDHIDLRRRTAHLPETKNGTPRTVPLSPGALEVLRDLPRRLDGKVFPLAPSTVSHSFAIACKNAGIEDLHFHDLRHEATSRLFERTDLDLMEIRQITGHKTLQMLARYTHPRADRIADRLAGAKRGAG